MKDLGAILSLSLLPSAAFALPTLRQRGTSGSVSIPFTKRTSIKAHGLYDRAVSAPLANTVLHYTVDVTIGTPPQSFELVLDTGSSDIWVYAPESVDSCATCTEVYFDSTKSSTLNKADSLGVFNITYGQPNSGVSGYFATDMVGVGGASVTQTFAIATIAHSGDPENGIFGIGPAGEESVVDYGIAPYPTFIDSLEREGKIDTLAYGISLNSISPDDDAAGTITFGESDKTKYTGDLVAFPLIEPAPNGQIALDIAAPTMSFNLGDGVVPVPASAVKNYTMLVDTGATIIDLPTDQFNFVAEAVNATPNKGFSTVDCALAQKTGGMDFAFSGPNGDLTIHVPWSELAYTRKALPEGTCIFGIKSRDASTARGMYVLGDTFIRSTYAYFDYGAATLSLAQAKYDH